MNSRILMVGMLSSALLQSGSGYLQLESAPVEKAPTLLAQERPCLTWRWIGKAVFKMNRCSSGNHRLLTVPACRRRIALRAK